MSEALLHATVVAGYGRECLARIDDGELLRCQVRGRQMQPVCGDRVEVARSSADQGVIEVVIPRATEFARAVHYRRKVLAANFTQVVILVACEPSFSDELICRMLVVAEQAGLPSIIVLNKFDLVEQRDRVHHHAVGDHRRYVGVQHAGRHELQGVLLTARNDRVAGIVAALITDDVVVLVREEVDDLGLPLVAPLTPYNNGDRHVGEPYRVCFVPGYLFRWPCVFRGVRLTPRATPR